MHPEKGEKNTFHNEVKSIMEQVFSFSMHLHFHKVKQTFTKEFCTTFCFVFTLGFLGLSLYLYERWTCNPRVDGKKEKKNPIGQR
jgi:hypothetical protein